MLKLVKMMQMLIKKLWPLRFRKKEFAKQFLQTCVGNISDGVYGGLRGMHPMCRHRCEQLSRKTFSHQLTAFRFPLSAFSLEQAGTYIGCELIVDC
jgi:hypothetical protein